MTTHSDPRASTAAFCLSTIGVAPMAQVEV